MKICVILYVSEVSEHIGCMCVCGSERERESECFKKVKFVKNFKILFLKKKFRTENFSKFSLRHDALRR